MNVGKLLQKYPDKFKASRFLMAMSYLFGSLLILAGIILLSTTAMTLFGDEVNIIGIIVNLALTALISVIGIFIFLGARGFVKTETDSSFILDCRAAFDQITKYEQAKDNEHVKTTYSDYSIDELLEVHHSIDHQKLTEQHSAVSYLLLQQMR